MVFVLFGSTREMGVSFQIRKIEGYLILFWIGVVAKKSLLKKYPLGGPHKALINMVDLIFGPDDQRRNLIAKIRLAST